MQMRKQSGSHPGVVGDQVCLGEAGRRIQDLVGVGQLQLPSVDLHLDAIAHLATAGEQRLHVKAGGTPDAGLADRRRGVRRPASARRVGGRRASGPVAG